jgi:hypothetical protein
MPEDSWWVAHVCDLESSARCGYFSGFRLGQLRSGEKGIPLDARSAIYQAGRAPMRLDIR